MTIWDKINERQSGHKIFVSYKFKDDNILTIPRIWNTTVRDYVNEFEDILNKSDHIYKGEHDDEDLSTLSEEAIWEKLKDRIYDSSVTVVFISPGMKESGVKERDQWIPWEISYSLKETARRNRNGDPVTSHTNAMVAVVLPDRNGNYSYFLEVRQCCLDKCRHYHTEMLFQIIRDNMFNQKHGDAYTCLAGDRIWHGEHSYIEAIRWSDFIADYDKYIQKAINRQNNIEDYNIAKEIKQEE